ncbi:MAG: RnfABCDGE type electron transport complex subunit G, partial [bacterium]
MAEKKKKKKLESNFINMFAVLTVVGLVSSFSLGYTYNSTKDKIKEIQQQKLKVAIGEVLPEFDSLRKKIVVSEKITDKKKKNKFKGFELFPAEKNGEIVGTAVKSVSNKGFSGDIVIMVGFDKDGNVENTAVLKHAETPGLGAKMEEESFRTQFQGLTSESFDISVKKDGGEVDSITA